jgi:Tfp pilus assembly protein PilF
MYRKGLELDPNIADSHHNLAVLLWRQNKVAEATAAYRKAAEVEPNNAVRHLNLSTILYSQEKYGEVSAGRGHQ